MLFSPSLARKSTFHSDYLDEEIVDLLGATFVIPQSYQCQVLPIDPGYEGRMDLIADALYNDEFYADMLGHLNGPSNPFEVNEDQYIILPAINALQDFYQEPAKEWDEHYINSQISRPKAKARNEKRKPNEAVIGDKRFNIDPLSKIIIY